MLNDVGRYNFVILVGHSDSGMCQNVIDNTAMCTVYKRSFFIAHTTHWLFVTHEKFATGNGFRTEKKQKNIPKEYEKNKSDVSLYRIRIA